MGGRGGNSIHEMVSGTKTFTSSVRVPAACSLDSLQKLSGQGIFWIGGWGEAAGECRTAIGIAQPLTPGKSHRHFAQRAMMVRVESRSDDLHRLAALRLAAKTVTVRSSISSIPLSRLSHAHTGGARHYPLVAHDRIGRVAQLRLAVCGAW